MVKMIYDRFLKVVAEHVTIIWPVLFWSLDDLPINFYRIRVKKYKHMHLLRNKREIQNYEKFRVIGLFCCTRVFWCNMRVFPIGYKHFTHVGMLQSRYKQCKVEWLLPTWSAYVRHFASSLFAISNTWVLWIVIQRGEGGWGLKVLGDRLTVCRWIGSNFNDCLDFYGVAFSAIFSRVTRMGLHIFETKGVRKLWQVRIHKQEDSW